MSRLNISRGKVTGRVQRQSACNASEKIASKVTDKLAEIIENKAESVVPDILTGTVSVAHGINFQAPVAVTLRPSVYTQAGRYTLFTWGEGYSFTGARNLRVTPPSGFFVSRVLLDTVARTLTVDLALYKGD